MAFRFYGGRYLTWGFKSSFRIPLFIIAVFVSELSGVSQNLIYNPGFELFFKCPDDYVVKHRKELIPGWIMPTSGTADYFNVCGKGRAGVPQNFMGYCLPKDGVAYAGLILLFEPPEKNSKQKPENYREYLQANLIKELEKNKLYEVSLYYSVSSYSTFAINRIGVYFSSKKIGNSSDAGVINVKPQIERDSAFIESEQYVWFHLKGMYKANGGEKYITIGNFYDDHNTRYVICDLSELSTVKKASVLKDRIAYYYIDAVLVREIKDQ